MSHNYRDILALNKDKCIRFNITRVASETVVRILFLDDIGWFIVRVKTIRLGSPFVNDCKKSSYFGRF